MPTSDKLNPDQEEFIQKLRAASQSVECYLWKLYGTELHCSKTWEQVITNVPGESVFYELLDDLGYVKAKSLPPSPQMGVEWAKMEIAVTDKTLKYGETTPGQPPQLRSPLEQSAFEWGAFISHASEDKEAIATPLANILLHDYGLRIWIDDRELKVGDRLREKIDEGLAKSRFGIVILSPYFFAKKWTENELEALLALESNREDRILPIWHNVTKTDVEAYSPMLAGRIGVSTEKGPEFVARELVKKIAPDQVKAAMPEWNTSQTSADTTQQPRVDRNDLLPPGTIVKGRITGSVEWTPDGNPYVVVGNVQIPPGAVLTIRPGVIVQVNRGKYVQVDGTLRALGSDDEMITFTTNEPGHRWASVFFAKDAVPWDEGTGHGSILDHVLLEHGGYGNAEGQSMGRRGDTIIAAQSAVKVSHCVVRYSGKDGITTEADSVIHGNIIENNHTRGILILNGQPSIAHNVIRNNPDSGIYAGGNSVPSISNNRIISNGQKGEAWRYGGGIRLDGSAFVLRNEIVTNVPNGIAIVGRADAGRIAIHENNLQDNLRYALFLYEWSRDVGATNNWWGELATDEMNRLGADADIQTIHDQHDDFSLGLVDYSNWAPSPFPFPD